MSTTPEAGYRTFVSAPWWAIGLVCLLHFLILWPSEPVFNGDSNRHVMTSVFFRDALVDLPFEDPRGYAEDYYRQYPALGLLIWPPLFHFVTGTAMFFLGTSVWVARTIVFLSCITATLCLLRVCCRRMSVAQAWLVATVFTILPMVFEFSRHVMLEMPTLALCMICIDQFDQWVAQKKNRYLYTAAVAAACAALTRFDAVVLLPIIALFLLFAGQTRRLLDKHVALAAIVALLLVAPTYLVIWNELGDLHLRQAAESVSGRDRPTTTLSRLFFYPALIPQQISWTATAFALVGILASFRNSHREAMKIFGAILIATFLTFTPLAELTPRHTIYWTPALAWLAAVGLFEIQARIANAGWRPVWAVGVCVSLFAGTVAATCLIPTYRVSGYAQAAENLIDRTQPGETILIEGWWDGNLTYQLRHLDSRRSRQITRADKVMYEFTNVPNVDFKQFVETDQQILKSILEINPRCIAFEDPQPFGRIEVSRQIRRLIRSKPQLFHFMEEIRVDSTVPDARRFSLFLFEVNTRRLRQIVNEESIRSAAG